MPHQDQLAPRTADQELALRAREVLNAFTEHVAIATYSLCGTHDASAERVRAHVGAMRRHLFDPDIPTATAVRTVGILFERLVEQHWRDVNEHASAVRFVAARLSPAALDARVGWRDLGALGLVRRRCHRRAFAEVTKHPLVAPLLSGQPARVRASRTPALPPVVVQQETASPESSSTVGATSPSPA
jgi:hypothetical protein